MLRAEIDREILARDAAGEVAGKVVVGGWSHWHTPC